MWFAFQKDKNISDTQYWGFGKGRQDYCAGKGRKIYIIMVFLSIVTRLFKTIIIK